MGAGVASGFVTAFLQTRLGVESILAGIIVNTGLYTINIAVMGFSSTINLFASKTIFTMAKEAIGGNWYEIISILIIIVIVAIVLILFLGTGLDYPSGQLATTRLWCGLLLSVRSLRLPSVCAWQMP